MYIHVIYRLETKDPQTSTTNSKDLYEEPLCLTNIAINLEDWVKADTMEIHKRRCLYIYAVND